MKATKIAKTETEGEHIVCKGKLILINKFPQSVSKYAFKSSNGMWMDAIIISETEEIEDGEDIYHIPTKTLNKFVKGDMHCHKVLALPENFSPKHLRAIADGKLKDGDEVFVQCEKYLTKVSEWQRFGDWEIKLNKDNHIKIFFGNKNIDAIEMADSNRHYLEDLYEREHGIKQEEKYFRVGRRQGRAVLNADGREVVLFPIGMEKGAQEYCDFLNRKEESCHDVAKRFKDVVSSSRWKEDQFIDWLEERYTLIRK